MIKVCKGLYLHFSLGLIFIIAIFSGTFEITVMAFLTAVCHELCHLTAALFLKEKCRGIGIMPYGCRLYMAESKSPVKEFFIASAGPLFNVLALVFVKVGPLRDINIAMAFINLFPVMPLDGGRMLYALLSIFKGPFFAVSAMRRISLTGGAMLIAAGIFQAFFMGFNLSVLTAGTILLFSAITEKGTERLFTGIFEDKGKLVSGAKRGRIIAAPENLPLRKVLSQIPHNEYAIVKVIGSDGKVKNEMSEDEIKDNILSLGAGVRFREIT